MSTMDTVREWPPTDRLVPCTECEGHVEPELLAAVPSASICLECLDETQRLQLETDLQQAQEVSHSLMPRRAPRPGLLDIGIHYAPSRLLSGDFYDVIVGNGSGRVALAAGDVVGKGIASSLLRVSLQTSLRVLNGEGLGPGRVLDRANEYFVASSGSNRFATVFYGELQSEKGTLVYGNAGHPAPLVRRVDGGWESLAATGTVLGILEESRYEERSCRLGRGDLLVLYTDGITEAEDAAGEFFDEPRLRAAVERNASAPAQDLADVVAAELEIHSAAGMEDDRTLLVVRRL